MKLFNKVKSIPISYLIKDNNRLRSRNRELVRLCHEKDSYFIERFLMDYDMEANLLANIWLI